MMCTQQYALRWNNYSTHISGAFDSLRHDDNLVDVTLSCDGGKIRAHKIMLSACSPYFRDLFKENPCQHPIVVLRNITYADLSAIVSFMYQGEVSVISDQLTSFLQTAEYLKVRGLTDSGRESPINYNDLDEEEVVLINNNNNSDIKNTSANPIELNERLLANCSTPIKREPDYTNVDKGVQKKRKHNDESGYSGSNVTEVKEKSASPKFTTPSPKNLVNCENDVYNDTGDDLIDVSELHSKQNFRTNQTATVTATATATYKRKDTIGTAPLKVEQNLDSTTSTGNKSTDPDDVKVTGEEDELLFRCRLCWKGFKHPMSLTLHRDAHEGKTECPVCRRHFSRSYDMRSHLTRIHKMTLSLDAKLDFCDDKV